MIIWRHTYSSEEIIRAIGDCRYVSFDIFDTLIKRTAANPSDVFLAVARRYGNLHQSDFDAETFKAVRSDAGNKGNLKRWGDRSQNVANVANATNASQKSQKVANVAVDADVDADADADKTPFGVIDNVSRSLSLKERQKMFYNELIPYVGKYTSVLLRSFFDYWSEPSQNGSKMRRELEKTWDTGKRLARWERNEKPTPCTPESRRDEASSIIARLMAEDDARNKTTKAGAEAVAELLASNE